MFHKELGFWLVDYKFCGVKKLDADAGSFRGKSPCGQWPLHNVPDNSLGHYLVQQTMYAFILKKRYGIEVKRSSLLHLPTDTNTVEARVVDLDLLTDEVVEKLLEKYNKRVE